MAVALWAILSGCAARIRSELPAHTGAAADLQCCGGQATAEGAAVPTSDVAAASGPVDAAGFSLCRSGVAVSESPLRRDAFGRAPVVGQIGPGEKLTLLDFIDRRLRVLGRVVLDGGHWLKVRGQRDDEGWLPAAAVREVRGPCEAEGVAMSGERSAPGQAGR